MPIEINADDVTRAEVFLETLLTEQIPNGRFTEGSALRDLVIKSVAFVFGHLQKETATVKALQSLLNVKTIATTDPDIDRAVANATDAILSNIFITRKSGSFARVIIFAEVSKRQDYIIPGNHRFVFDRDHVFFPDTADTTQNIVIRSADLIPVLATDGSISAYQFSLNVVASKTGTDFNVAAGNWKSGTSFSPFATRVFTIAKASGGKGRETVSEVISRSNSAIAVRNLINERSLNATLRERYSILNRMVVVGMGDPEMRRDLKLEVATAFTLHVGGHYDVYLELPRTQRTFDGLLGGTYVRPDNIINVFRDATITTWLTTGVQAGDVIRVGSGLDESPKDFVIKEVLAKELRISVNTPFSVATDEVGTFVTYFIYRPLFLADTQVVPSVGTNTTGSTSRQVTNANRLILPGGAHYEVVDVMVTDPTTGDIYINATDGFVHFPIRSNQTPQPIISAQLAEYQITSGTPALGQSELCFEELLLPAAYNNKHVRIKYETLVGLDTIHAYTRSRFERVLAGNILMKGFHPVYLSVNIPYKLKPTETGSIDETALRQVVTDYINDFDPNDVIDVSDITTATRNYSSLIGTVSPLTITYELIVPDGRIIRYSTENEVAITSDNIVAGYTNATLADPLSYGISDRTVRYMSTLARITVENIT